VAADELGYESIWTWDHVYPIVGGSRGPILEGYMLLAAWATVTRRSTLGLMVGANTFRNLLIFHNDVSGELFRKVTDLYQALGRPVPTIRPRDNLLKLELANGSRVVALPGNEATVRRFSGARLLVIDEASRVPDALYRAVRPMLAVSRGRLVALSTPFGKRGWYHDEWHGSGNWQRVRITADQCARISPEFLAEERRALGERGYGRGSVSFTHPTLPPVYIV